MTKVEFPEFLIQKRKLKNLYFLLLFLPMVFALITTPLIYIFQDFITPFVDSYTFCNNQNFSELFWIIPKLMSHCHMITNSELRTHSSSDIAVVIDVYVALFTVLYFVINLFCSWIAVTNYRAIIEHQLKSEKIGSEKLLLYGLGGIFLIYISIEFTFFSSELIADADGISISRLSAMFSSSLGIGPLFHAGHAILAPILFARVVTLLFVHYSGNTKR